MNWWWLVGPYLLGFVLTLRPATKNNFKVQLLQYKKLPEWKRHLEPDHHTMRVSAFSAALFQSLVWWIYWSFNLCFKFATYKNDPPSILAAKEKEELEKLRKVAKQYDLKMMEE